MEPKSRLPRGSCGTTPEAVSEMLKTAQNLIQMAHQLLQQGPEVQGSRVEGAQVKVEERVVCVSVSCQTEFEPAETEASGASWGVAQLKAQL